MATVLCMRLIHSMSKKLQMVTKYEATMHSPSATTRRGKGGVIVDSNNNNKSVTHNSQSVCATQNVTRAKIGMSINNSNQFDTQQWTTNFRFFRRVDSFRGLGINLYNRQSSVAKKTFAIILFFSSRDSTLSHYRTRTNHFVMHRPICLSKLVRFEAQASAPTMGRHCMAEMKRIGKWKRNSTIFGCWGWTPCVCEDQFQLVKLCDWIGRLLSIDCFDLFII